LEAKVSERDLKPRIRGSVFVKLVAIMLTMAASLLLIVAGFFWLIIGPSLGISIEHFTKQYAGAIAATSPNLEEARRLRDRLDVQMRYEGPEGSWATDKELPTVTEVRNGVANLSSQGRDYYLAPAPNGGTYLFAWNLVLPMHAVHMKLLVMLLVLMAAVLVAAHIVLRILLRPVRWLGEGVERLGEGQLDVVLPVRTRDEFGVLTEAFNRMVRRVKEIVQARDQLLLDVSHELRSPLTRLKVALEFLPASENRVHMAADVREMELMVAELLELERLRDGRGIKTVRQDLLPILREVADDFKDRLPGVSVIASAGEIPLDIDGDKVRIVLRNLLENAFKYSLLDSRAVEVSVSLDDHVAMIRVRDDGLGVPENDIASIFEPFFRVDRSRSKKTGGYGLGLSICKRIMEAHGGGIAVENNGARGVSFVLTFPNPV